MVTFYCHFLCGCNDANPNCGEGNLSDNSGKNLRHQFIDLYLMIMLANYYYLFWAISPRRYFLLYFSYSLVTESQLSRKKYIYKWQKEKRERMKLQNIHSDEIKSENLDFLILKSMTC